MNKEQLIALGLSEEQASSVIEGFGKMIPKSRLDEKIGEVNDYKQQLTDRDTQLAELQIKAAGNEELQAQIQALQEQNEQVKTEFEAQLQQKDFEFALDNELRNAKAKNTTAVKSLLKLDSIKLDGDKFIGLEEQLAALKTSDDYLFTSEKLKGGTPNQGGTPPGTVTKEQFDAMNYLERVELYEKDATLFAKLSE